MKLYLQLIGLPSNLYALVFSIEHSHSSSANQIIYIYVWIYENSVKDWIKYFLIYLFFLIFFVDCRLSWNVETLCRMFHLFRYFFHYLSTPPPPHTPFSICVKFSPGYTHLNLVRAVTLTRSDRLVFSICCLEEVCPRSSLSPVKAQV